MSWTVETVMTPKVVAVRPQTTYRELVELMESHGISAVPVVDITDSEGRVVGIVSEADLLLKEEHMRRGRRSLPPLKREAKASARDARALMTSPAITIRPRATLADAARLMHRKGVKRLPVVDDRGRLVGIVSRADLLKAFTRSDESIRREVVEEVAGRILPLEQESVVNVSVNRGVVTLEGELDLRSLTQKLVHLTEQVEGTVGVDNRLTYWIDDTHPPSDAPVKASAAASRSARAKQ